MTSTDTSMAVFLEEYADFFHELAEAQRQKLDDVLSGKLILVERSIVSQQTLDMRMNNLEARRVALQQRLGLGNMSLREIIAKAPLQEKALLQKLCDRISKDMEEAKALNSNAMDVVSDRLKQQQRMTEQPPLKAGETAEAPRKLRATV